MLRHSSLKALGSLVLIAGALPGRLFGLDPSKNFAQYTRTIWTQAQGLPQDTIRAIAQTPDGYIWLGTTDGLARFDGYEFVTFTKDQGNLPSNSVTALCVGHDGRLWVGTSDGLAVVSGKNFQTYNARDGLPPGSISSLIEDHEGTLWVVSNGVLSILRNGRFTTYPGKELAPVKSTRVVYEDPQNELWVAGVGGVVKRTGGRFSGVFGERELRGNIVTSILKNRDGLWLAGSQGVLLSRARGGLQWFRLPHILAPTPIALLQDRSGNLWIGRTDGLSKLENNRFVSAPNSMRDLRNWIWSLFEDREGDLWIGMNSALIRLRDDRFTAYTEAEGLPADEPVAAFQDSRGGIWAGYHSSGLVALRPDKPRTYTVQDGLPTNEIFSIRGAQNGDLLIGSGGGVSRMHGGKFQNYSVPDPAGRRSVFDAIEDRKGRLWAATASGVYEFDGKAWRSLVGQSASPSGYALTLLEDRDGSMWAGTLVGGLWHIPESGAGTKPRLYTTADGLGGNQVRSLYQDSDGTLWIGTFGGGLGIFRNGKFHRYTSRDGLLSDNISHVEDDRRGSLWLSTSRGISRISKQELKDFVEGKIATVIPQNYGVADGLPSAQCAPGFPAGSGGVRSKDGRLWFPTSGGLATIDLAVHPPTGAVPIAHIIEVTAANRDLDFQREAQLKPDANSIQFRYAGLFLNAPERVRYSYRLEGLDRDWISAGSRRSVNYNYLPHGRYRFVVRAQAPDGQWTGSHFDFTVLPHFYQTGWFVCSCIVTFLAIVYGLHWLHLKQIQSRFALILDERVRLSREIHDTLAQGFVGIATQLDALSIKFGGDPVTARQHLDLARKMARYSLTEARRSVTDLRVPAVEEPDLAAALRTSARRWVAGASVDIQLAVPEIGECLPNDLVHNFLRIAQEAVANTLKHARAKHIWVELQREGAGLRLRVTDDGEGFEPSSALTALGGHYGILGMRERAEKLGGAFLLASRPGSGTQIEVTIPLASRSTIIN